MLKILNISLFIFLFLVMYIGQGVIYEVGSPIAKLGFFLYSLCSIFFISSGVLICYTKIPFYRNLLLFMLLNLLYFIFNPNGFGLIYFDNFRTIYFIISTFFIFFYLSAKNKILFQNMLLYFFILLLIAIPNYYAYAKEVSLDFNIQNNAIYSIVMILPFLFLIKNRLIAFSLLFFLILFIILSFKRGAIVTSFLIAFSFFIYKIKETSNNLSNVNRFFSKFTMIIVAICVFYFCIDFLLSNEIVLERFKDIENDGGSSRDIIFIDILTKSFQFSKILNLIFGYGFVGSMNFGLGGTAHNDILEVFSNFGLFGLAIFVGIWYSLWIIIRNRKLSQRDNYIVITILIVWIVDSQYQQVYNSIYSFGLMMLLGYILGKNKELII
jgi:hypothetical protein